MGSCAKSVDWSTYFQLVNFCLRMSVKAAKNFLEGFGLITSSSASPEDGKEPNIVCHSGWESEENIRRFDHQDIKEGVKIPDEDFFEGAEKLLEVSWAPRGDLRCLPRTTIEEILRLAR